MICQPKPNLVDKLYDDLLETAANADPNLPLTDDQQFAIAYLAGIPFHSSYENGKLILVSKPCAIHFNNGQWEVYSIPPEND